MEMSGHEAAAMQTRVRDDLRLSCAINALDAIRDLLGEAAEAEHDMLHHVSAENFACLLDIIVKEMRAAHASA